MSLNYVGDAQSRFVSGGDLTNSSTITGLLRGQESLAQTVSFGLNTRLGCHGMADKYYIDVKTDAELL